MIRFGLFGAGFIGSVHARNICQRDDCQLATIFDPVADGAIRLANETGARVELSVRDVLNHDIDAIIIASSTPSHADLLRATTRAGIPVLCEKPIHLDMDEVLGTVRECLKTQTLVKLGFNRRFDPEHAMLKDHVASGKAGILETMSLISRGPTPPPISYIKTSGGFFRDTMIHFFDLACWIADELPQEIYALGSCMVDPNIAKAGDVDTAIAVLKMPSGALITIDNSRRTDYGYDERIEAFCSKQLIQSSLQPRHHLMITSKQGRLSAGPHAGWFERMEPTYKAELEGFIRGIKGKTGVGASLVDGVRAQLRAEAAEKSRQTRQPVRPEWEKLELLVS